MNQWLNACVAVERTFTVIIGINFNKKKKLKQRKYLSLFLKYLEGIFRFMSKCSFQSIKCVE
jgi:hypothetical protein